jgi:hypothetical protein
MSKHDQEFKDIKEDLKYIRSRVDALIDVAIKGK